MSGTVWWGIASLVMPGLANWLLLDACLRCGPLPGAGPAAGRRLRRLAAPWRWVGRAVGIAALAAQAGWLGWPWWTWPLTGALDLGWGELLWRQTLRKQFPHLS